MPDIPEIRVCARRDHVARFDVTSRLSDRVNPVVGAQLCPDARRVIHRGLRKQPVGIQCLHHLSSRTAAVGAEYFTFVVPWLNL